MPTLADTTLSNWRRMLDANEVSMLVGGKLHTGWDSYTIESDLLTPADAWRLRLELPGGRLPDGVRSGETARICIGTDATTIMTGRIDDVHSSVRRDAVSLDISGRDLAGQLVDCSVPIFTAQLLTLEQLVARITQPFGVKKIRIDADNALMREKFNVEPGDSAWEALQHAAEANGLWPWFEPDGTLVVGGPDYSAPPVATLVLRLPPKEANNNVELFELTDCSADSYSEVTVLSQTHGGGELRTANHAIKGRYTDPSVNYYRPKIVIDHESDTIKHAEERARKLVMDSRLKRWTLSARVAGHIINAPGQPGHGKPWAPGMRVNVVDEAHKLDTVCFLMARSFEGGRNQAPVTHLTLKEDGVWIVAAHPHKRRHRRGKNAVAGAVWDIANAPEAGK